MKELSNDIKCGPINLIKMFKFERIVKELFWRYNESTNVTMKVCCWGNLVLVCKLNLRL